MIHISINTHNETKTKKFDFFSLYEISTSRYEKLLFNTFLIQE